MSRPTVDWNDASKQYQTSVGAVSGRTAFELVDMATALVGFDDQSTILDAGCGPGAVTLAIMSKVPNANIEAIDTAPKMLDDLNTNISKSGESVPHVKTRIVDINKLESTYAEGTFSHIFASLAIHVASPDYVDCVRQIYKVLKPGGVFAFASFTPHSDPYLIWDRVCRIFDPTWRMAQWSPDPHAWTTPGEVGAGLQLAGFVDIKSVIRRNRFPFDSTEAWVDFFWNGRNPASDRVKRPFFEAHNIPNEQIRQTYEKVVREEWDARNIVAEFTMAIGRKPF